MLQLFALFISGLLNLVLGVVVYTKNPKRDVNKLFFLLTLSIIIWSGVNYMSVSPALLTRLAWIRLVLFFAAPLSLLIFLTFTAFPASSAKLSPRIRTILFIVTPAVMILTLTPLVFKGIVGKNPTPNFAIALFALYVVATIGGGVLSLIKKYRVAVGQQRDQLRFVLVGLSGTFGLIILTNFVFVVLFNYNKLIPFGASYTLIFTAAFAYAIIRHKLFDIRAAIARSVGYLLAVGSLVGIYSIGLFGILNIVFKGQDQATIRQVASVILLAPLVISFSYVKVFFDKVTNRLFYKQSYDIQEVLDSVGDIVVAEIDLDKVINKTRDTLSGALKSSFFEFVLIKSNQPHFEASHQLAKHLSDINKYISRQSQELLVTEDLEKQSSLKEALILGRVAISLRLRTQKQIVGYILIGDKRSGESYSPQDKRLLTIVASELAIAVQNALRFEEIQSFNVTLQQKVDEATRKLRVSNQKLKSLDETKDDFISMASHQLRTPLTSVKGYVSMVLDGDAGEISPMQRKLLTQSFISSQRMVYLIADLLNISRLKTGKFVIEPVPTNLADALAGEVDQLVETAKGRELTLTYHRPDNFPTYMLDETKIRQVMMNFMDNAIYYTPGGGHIDVEVKNNSSDIVFTVTDNGIGVPKDQQHHLFSKFYRAPNALRARPDGTGLGLYMAKKVILAQGGSIIFKSTEGKGSTFGFSFSKSNLTLAPEKKTFITR